MNYKFKNNMSYKFKNKIYKFPNKEYDILILKQDNFFDACKLYKFITEWKKKNRKIQSGIVMSVN